MPIAYLGIKFNIPQPENFKSAVEKALIFNADKTYYSYRDNLELFAWEKDLDLIPIENWYESDSMSICMSGYGMDDSGSEKLHPQVFASAKDYENVWNRYHGEWSAILLLDNCIMAGSSTIGTLHSYIAECSSFVAVSNRARILWTLLHVCGEPIEHDWITLSSLLSVGYPFCTNGTAVKQVKIIPSTQFARIDKYSKNIQFLDLDNKFFRPESNNLNIDWGELSNCMRNNLRWLENINSIKIAAITGGKDTRLILSLLKNSNMTKDIKFYIRAPEEHADYLVASNLAEKLEIDFERIDRPPIDNLIESMRYHVGFTEGLLNAWDLKPETDYNHAIFIHGLFGELYRGKEILQIYDFNEISQKILLENFSILNPEVLQEQKRKILMWLNELASRDIPLSFALDLFYLLQRVPRFIGQTRLHDALNGIHFNPLYHPKVLKAFYKLSDEDRRGERIHFETMIRLCPKLAAVPFAKQKWDSGMIQRSTWKNANLSQTNIINTKKIIGVGWQVLALNNNWKEVKHKIMDEVSGLSFLINEKKVKTLLNELKLNVVDKNSFINKSWKRAGRRLGFKKISISQKELIMKVMGLLTILTLNFELKAPGEFQVKLN
jgi:hypothetical protein